MIDTSVGAASAVWGRGKRRLLPLTAALVALAGGLAITNPGPDEFEHFAGHHLVALIDTEVCQKPALPALLQVMIQDCAALVRAQQQPLGRLALERSRRLNLGLASIYRTSVGGNRVLNTWQVPRYGITTLAVAGHFVVLSTSTATP